MSYRRLIVASGGTVVALAIVASAALARLPIGTRLPVHWNAAGEVDRLAAAHVALFTPAVVAAGLSLLMIAIPRIEPMQRQMERSAGLLRTAWAGLLMLIALSELVVAAPAFGWALPKTLHQAGIGLFLIALGNALPKSRPGFFIGIRTPWTLTDEDNWIATHRLGAWTMIAGGIMLVVAAMVSLSSQDRAHATLIAIAIAVVPPVVYSYLFWRRRTHAAG